MIFRWFSHGNERAGYQLFRRGGKTMVADLVENLKRQGVTDEMISVALAEAQLF